jgi:carbamoylphosphate synthase large subunit
MEGTNPFMTAPVTVWYNKGFSNLYSVFDIIKKADSARQFRLICTHTSPEFVGFLTCDLAAIEPVMQEDVDYLHYCLEFCEREGVRLFVPGRRMAYLAHHQADFANIGVKMLVAADGATLDLLDSKAGLYQRLAPESIVPIPDYAIIQSIAEYDAAVATLRAKHETICVKPNTGVYGLGFHILANTGREIDRILNGGTRKIGQALFRALLAEAESFQPLMVMQYLEGPERSVDCLADHGTLLRWVVRLKPSRENGAQLLEDNPEISRMTANLTRLLGLHGLFNVQFKESGGVPYLLEINPRMSGGLPFACHSGFNFPYWLLKMALGECPPDNLPHPRTGGRVAQVMTGVALR